MKLLEYEGIIHMQSKRTIGHLIDGQTVHAGGRAQEVFNPATGAADKRVLLADRHTVEAAIASVQAAFPAWRNTPPLKRARVMSKLKQLLEQHAGAICALITPLCLRLLAAARRSTASAFP